MAGQELIGEIMDTGRSYRSNIIPQGPSASQIPTPPVPGRRLPVESFDEEDMRAREEMQAAMLDFGIEDAHVNERSRSEDPLMIGGEELEALSAAATPSQSEFDEVEINEQAGGLSGTRSAPPMLPSRGSPALNSPPPVLPARRQKRQAPGIPTSAPVTPILASTPASPSGLGIEMYKEQEAVTGDIGEVTAVGEEAKMEEPVASEIHLEQKPAEEVQEAQAEGETVADIVKGNGPSEEATEEHKVEESPKEEAVHVDHEVNGEEPKQE